MYIVSKGNCNFGLIESGIAKIINSNNGFIESGIAKIDTSFKQSGYKHKKGAAHDV